VAGVDLAIDQAVAHGGPGLLAAQLEPDAVLFVQAQDRGHDQGGAVGQGHEADFQGGLFGAVGAGDECGGHCFVTFVIYMARRPCEGRDPICTR
jgi:hypothetical protein